MSRLHHVYFNDTSTSGYPGNPPASRLPATKVTTSAYIEVEWKKVKWKHDEFKKRLKLEGWLNAKKVRVYIECQIGLGFKGQCLKV